MCDYNFSEFEKKLDEFMGSYEEKFINGKSLFIPNQWVYDDGVIRLYCRLMNVTRMFTVASVDVAEDMQKKGIFSQILRTIISKTQHLDGIEVENIHNPHLYDSLLKKGYRESRMLTLAIKY